MPKNTPSRPENKPLDLRAIEQRLAYSHTSPTGLVWTKDATVAGSSRRAYWSVGIGGKDYPAHRIVWALLTGDDPGPRFLDHVDGDGKNNRIDNLRLVSNRQNCWNTRAQGGSSLYKGVGRASKSKSWTARIRAHGVPTNLGSFDSEEDAAKAYNAAATKAHGEHARVNLIGLPGHTGSNALQSAISAHTEEERQRWEKKQTKHLTDVGDLLIGNVDVMRKERDEARSELAAERAHTEEAVQGLRKALVEKDLEYVDLLENNHILTERLREMKELALGVAMHLERVRDRKSERGDRGGYWRLRMQKDELEEYDRLDALLAPYLEDGGSSDE